MEAARAGGGAAGLARSSETKLGTGGGRRAADVARHLEGQVGGGERGEKKRERKAEGDGKGVHGDGSAWDRRGTKEGKEGRGGRERAAKKAALRE